MIALVLTSLLLTAGFVFLATKKEHRLPESISEMVYVFNGGWRWMWTAYVWAVSIITGACAIECLPVAWKFIGFLMTVCLCFVGAMPLFDKTMQGTHALLALAGGVLSQAVTLLICPWCLTVWLAYPVMVYFYKRGKLKWMSGRGLLIVEVLCQIAVVLSIIVR